jgi:hypothetical protein
LGEKVHVLRWHESQYHFCTITTPAFDFEEFMNLNQYVLREGGKRGRRKQRDEERTFFSPLWKWYSFPAMTTLILEGEEEVL